MAAAFARPVAVGDSSLCMMCKMVSAFVRKFVENNATKVCVE